MEPLAALDSLEEVVIAGTAVRDLRPLARLPRLRRVVVDSEQQEGASQAGLCAEVD
ncbi:MAG: hypothetical protein MJE77_19550 [Proteobacteria bacterium]|nr:hypothetical protein [Pseudomonadota bacterium]